MQVDHVRTNPFPQISAVLSTQYRYEVMRRAGESHNMAELLALRAFPATRTDVEFNRGRCNGNQFEGSEGLGDYYAHVADRAGVSVTGKHYCSGLAEFPGDPEAWVSGKGDVLRVARAKGMKVSGMVEYDPGGREPAPDVEIDPAIVDALTDDVMDMGGGSRREDVREAAHARLTGRGPEGPLRVKDPTEDW